MITPSAEFDAFQANTFDTGKQILPQVAGLVGGGFVVAWQSEDQDGDQRGIFMQRYGPDALLVGPEVQVNTYTDGPQYEMTITGLTGGGFVVTWYAQTLDGGTVVAQIYDAVGATVGSEFTVNTEVLSSQRVPAIAATADGGFVIAWQSFGQDPDAQNALWDIYGQRYQADGTALGGEFQINTIDSFQQVEVALAAFSSGGYVAVWQSVGDPNGGESDTSFDVKMQRYDASGVSVGSETTVNTHLPDYQNEADVAVLADDGFVVTWVSFSFTEGSPNQDGSGYGIFAQRYNAAGQPAGAEFQVNTHFNGSQVNPSIVALPDGGFMIAWMTLGSPGDDYSGWDILAQRFAADGTMIGAEFALHESDANNSTANDDQTDIDLSVLDNGAVIATYADGTRFGTDVEVMANAYGYTNIDPTESADTIIVYGFGQYVQGLGGGDIIHGADDAYGSDYLAGGDGEDVLYGNAGDDRLSGGADGDTLDGGEGDDRMSGGAGNDLYIVDSAGDMVSERAGEGDDIIDTFVSYDVPVNVEVLRMQGTADLGTNGSVNRDIIQGNSGNNYINGGGGIDVMIGGDGNDTYTIDDSQDAVIEAAGGGDDVIYTSVDYVLLGDQEIETAILTENAVILRGDNSDNQLIGNDFINVLEGKGGTDYLLGLGGDDIFQVSLEANATDLDVFGDFEGAGVIGGDRIALDGAIWGMDGIVYQVSQTSFIVATAQNTMQQQFQIANITAPTTNLIAGDDYYFG
ncbi:calcium-binding protein [Ahrensia sp. R2A130]|uniref:calcium-binding protein n=1 Tax=Ahrensia sp. R2A130 TaxID=744979 RepID=UPI0012E9E654|nr:calcium-binding protein [Ahrensia sp. R2A130]